jgi:hypothetical protein
MSAPKSVEVFWNAIEWMVRVVEGESRSERSFTRREFADAFAEGQRARLGLARPSVESDCAP